MAKRSNSNNAESFTWALRRTVLPSLAATKRKRNCKNKNENMTNEGSWKTAIHIHNVDIAKWLMLAESGTAINSTK
eukprot:g18995.t1